MSKPILINHKEVIKLPEGTNLISAYPTGNDCSLVSTCPRKKEITVQYNNGKTQTWNASHISKYYVVKDSTEHAQLIKEGVESFAKRSQTRKNKP